MHIIKEPVEYSFDTAGQKGKVFPINHLVKKTQIVYIEMEKKLDATLIEYECDFIYYVLEGKGYFLINDKKEKCKKGDLVVIPAGTKFTYVGKIKLLLVTTPPYSPKQEEIL
jgi:mannose-6-phosphate isomerase-like protein (cupin superfamily)